jgi:hypothetical protein
MPQSLARLAAAAALAVVLGLGGCLDAPKEDAGVGKMCGGIAAIPCAPGQYCHMPPGQCRNISDSAGACLAKPQICPMIYAPVCGCDGNTYPNACQAASRGVSVARQGACKG